MRRFNDSLSTKVYHWKIKSFFFWWFNIYKLIRSNITICYKVLTHSLRGLSIFPFLIVISCTWIDPIAPPPKIWNFLYFKIILHINQKIPILTKDVCIFKPSVFIPLFTFTCIIKIFEQLQMKKNILQGVHDLATLLQIDWWISTCSSSWTVKANTIHFVSWMDYRFLKM